MQVLLLIEHMYLMIVIRMSSPLARTILCTLFNYATQSCSCDPRKCSFYYYQQQRISDHVELFALDRLVFFYQLVWHFVNQPICSEPRLDALELGLRERFAHDFPWDFMAQVQVFGVTKYRYCRGLLGVFLKLSSSIFTYGLSLGLFAHDYNDYTEQVLY